MRIFSIIALIIYFIVLLLAVSREKKNNSVLDYFFGGRSLPFWALSITFIASWWGAGSAISTADLAYEQGIGAFWYYGVPVLISSFLMIIFSKAIRKVGYLTQGEMMENRYNKICAKVLSIMILLFMTITAASQMVGIGDFLGSYLGLNYELAVIIGTSIVLIYSLFGGFRGVVLTDIIQFVTLLISAVVVFVVALIASGGFAGIAGHAQLINKANYFDFFGSGQKYISYVITFGCAWMIQANVWQRISAARNEKDAKKMTILSFFVYIPLYLIVVFTGMAGSVLYDKIPEGGIVPAIINDYVNPILGAIVFVGISAAIMSTMDSLINTGAMTLTIDLLGDKVKDKKLKYSRLATLIVTLVALWISLRIRSILDVSWIASDIITNGVFVPLLFGFIWRRGTSKGAVASMIFGGIYSFYNLLSFLGVPVVTFWQTQSAEQTIIGITISAVTYIFISLITKPEYEKADIFIQKAIK